MGVCDVSGEEGQQLPLPPQEGEDEGPSHQQLEGISEESSLMSEDAIGGDADDCRTHIPDVTVVKKKKEHVPQIKVDSAVFQHPDVDGGWAWVVLLGGIMALAVVSALFYTFNLYFVLLMDAFNATRGETAWVGSLNSAFFMLAGPLATESIIRLGGRGTIFVAGILAALGFIGSSMAPNLSVLMFTHGVVTAIGCCLNYAAWITVLGTYFRRRHSLATSFLLSGTGLGLFFYAPILKMVIEEYSWRGSYLINAGLALNFCVFGALVFPLRAIKTNGQQPLMSKDHHLRPNKLPHQSTSSLYLCGTTASFISHSMSNLNEGRGKGPKSGGWFSSSSSVKQEDGSRVRWRLGGSIQQDEPPVIPGAPEGGGLMHRLETFFKKCRHRSKVSSKEAPDLANDGQIPTKDLFKDVVFLSLLASSFLWVMACNTVYIVYNDFANWQGLGEYFTYALSAMGLGDMFGRIMSGFVCNSGKIDPSLLFTLAQVMCTLCVLGFNLINSGYMLAIMGTLFSFTYGIQNVCIAVVPAQTFGTQNLNRIFGFLLFACGLGSLIGAPIAGWIMDATESYTIAFVFAAMMELASAIATCICWRRSVSKCNASNQDAPPV